MCVVAFAFFRGTAAIMAADLAASPDTGLRVQACGDAHLVELRHLRHARAQLVFDVNDFDETLPGPFEWDVKRLAASVGSPLGTVASRGASAAPRCWQRWANTGPRGSFATMNEIDVWYARLDVSDIASRWQEKVTKEDRRRLEKSVAKARNKDSLRALEKLTESRDGELRIASRPPLLVPIAELAKREGAAAEDVAALIKGLLIEYRRTLDDQARVLAERYHYVDAAHKVVGVGSVGTRAWIALLLGRDESDPLFLQVKEAGPSVLEPFAGASRFRHHGHRVVSGERLTQAAGDVLLGWLTAEGLDGQERDFYVRQLWDGKGSAEIESMGPQTMAGYAGLCGWSLARAHARTGDRLAIAAYLGKSDAFDQAIAEFSEAYADQNEADYRALLDARRDGRLTVESGV